MKFGRHFYGFRLHFGGHFGGKKLQKSMPKLNEKMDAILEGIFREHATGRRASRSQHTDLRSDQEQEFQESG